jgi:hypothetical protein
LGLALLEVASELAKVLGVHAVREEHPHGALLLLAIGRALQVAWQGRGKALVGQLSRHLLRHLPPSRRGHTAAATYTYTYTSTVSAAAASAAAASAAAAAVKSTASTAVASAASATAAAVTQRE